MKNVRMSAVSLTLAVGVAVVAAMGASAPHEALPDAPLLSTGQAASFASDIMPIFEASCINCHGGEYEGEQRMEAALDLRTYEATMAGSEFGSVIEPGDPDKSILLDMIAVGDMPEEGDPLTPEQIELVRTWIAEGAEDN